MSTLSHAEQVLLGLAEPEIAVLPLTSAEEAFAGAEMIERDLRQRPRLRRAVPSAPLADIPEEPAPDVEPPPPAQVDLSSVVEAIRELRASLPETPAQEQPVQVEMAEPLPAAYRIIRDHLGRAERVLMIEKGLNASESAPASYRVVRDDLGRMVSIEYEA